MTLFGVRRLNDCLITVLVLGCVLGDCPTHYLSHHHRDKTVCCLPAFNCGPNAEIIECREDLGQDVCQNCSSGYINPNVVSSGDKIQHSCFKKESHHELCPLDTVPTVNLSSSSACLLYCTCRTIDCYYGDEPCSCEGPQTPCKENETLDPDSGDCVPCPENSYKLEPGCGPCTWNVTAVLGDLSKNTEKAQSKETPTSPVSGLVIIVPDGPMYNVSKSDNQTDTPTDTGGKDDGFSPAPVIAIVVVLLIVAILVAIVLVTYRKLQSNDDHSKLVKCYHALCPGRQLEAQAGLRDTESVTDPPYHPVQQSQEKPLQHVTPITRVNGTKHESPDAYNDCSTIPYADMSMSPVARPPSLGTSLEEINEEEEQEPSSVSPLIEDTEITDSVDPELTAQKTAA